MIIEKMVNFMAEKKAKTEKQFEKEVSAKAEAKTEIKTHTEGKAHTEAKHEHKEIKPESKTETKAHTEAKHEHKEPKTETKTEAKTPAKKEVKKFIQYVKKENKAKSKEARDNQKKLLAKTHTPVFRGRFGKKNIRRKSIAKWDKWRKPHGIDLDKGLQHGFRPKIGYGRACEIRDIHPSGYIDVLVCNINDLEKIKPKTEAARFSRTIGKRKRNELMKKANEKGIWVLN